MGILSKEVQDDIASLINSNREKFMRIISQKFPNATEEDIKDCFQELFVAAYENYESFNKSQNKIGWLFVTLRNLLSNRLREPNKKNILFSELPDNLIKNDHMDDDIVFGILTNHLSEEELKNAVLSRFSSKEMTLYNLRYKEKLPAKDIAKKLGVPCGTVRRRLFDLNQKVRKIIESGIIDKKAKK